MDSACEGEGLWMSYVGVGVWHIHSAISATVLHFDHPPDLFTGLWVW